MSREFYKRGDYKAVCDVCGFFYLASKLKSRWDGLKCCPKDWNPRQPQDFVKSLADPQSIPWGRPDTTPVFVPITPYIPPSIGYPATINTYAIGFVEINGISQLPPTHPIS